MTCSDCGCAPVWRHSDKGYCRRCHSKAGYQTYVQIDLDKLDELVGTEKADEILRECRYMWNG